MSEIEEGGINSQKHFAPDYMLEGEEIDSVVKGGIDSFREILDKDPYAKWSRQSDPPDSAMPYKHNTVIKEGVTYSFSDASLLDDDGITIIGDRMHILRVDKLNNEEEITLVSGINDNPSSIEHRAVFLGDEQRQPIFAGDFQLEKRRGKLSRVASFLGFNKPSVPENSNLVDRDYDPLNSGLAVNGMYDMLLRARVDFAQKPYLDTTS